MWRRVLPIYLRYMLTRWRCSRPGLPAEERSAIWERRHMWGAERVHAMVQDLSGWFVKSAQIMASKGDCMPRAWVERLACLWDAMPPRPWPEVRQSLQYQLAQSPMGAEAAATGGRLQINAVFESVEQECLASASIAQVHAAVLEAEVVRRCGWGCGKAVVVKVQHRRMEGLMHADLRNIGRLARFLRSVLPFEVMPAVEEIREAVPKEFDFRREARLMAAIAARLQVAGHAHIHIPRVITHLSSKRLLVMQHMEGKPFTQLLPVAKTDEVLRGRAIAAVRHLLDSFGQMLLLDGLFQADPHPGNLLLREDGGLVLLDFGQCKALTAQRQLGLAHLYLALAQGNPATVTLRMAQVGLDFRALNSHAADPELVHKMALIFFDTRLMPEACISPFSPDSVIKSIPLTAFPADLYMVIRAMMLLRGLCFELGVDVHLAPLWRKYAEALLADPAKEARAEMNRKIDVQR